MKHVRVAFLLLPAVLAGSAPARAEPAAVGVSGAPHGLGVGLVLGEPTGLAAAWRSPGSVTAWDAALAWSVPDERIHAHVDWLLTVATYEDPAAPDFDIPFYVGVGPRVRVGWDGGVQDADASVIGIRIPAGVVIRPHRVPVDGFLELVPVLGVYPATRLDLDAALGARVWFGRVAAPAPEPEAASQPPVTP